MLLQNLNKVKNQPEFKKLVKTRSVLAWQLSFSIVVVYFAFILLLAFTPNLFNWVIIGEHITLGFLVGIAMIVFAIALSGVYVKKANDDFDRLSNALHKELK